MFNFSKNILQNKTLAGNVCTFVVVILTVGYPLNAIIGPFLGYNIGQTSALNLKFRALYTGISILLFFWAVVQKSIVFSKVVILSIVFLLFLTVRILYDREIREIEFSTDAYVYGYFFGNILIPAIAIAITTRYAAIKNFNKLLFVIVFLANLSIFLFLALNSESLNIFEGRVSIAIKSDYNDEESLVINPITFSYFGSLLAILSLSLLLIKNYLNFNKFFLLATTGIGLFNLLLGASRGPTLIFFLLLAIILYKHFKEAKVSSLYSLSFVAIASVLVVGLVNSWIFLSKLTIFDRFLTFADRRANNEKEERDFEWESAINHFLDSPVWGDRYIQDYDDFYPHNIFLESLMSTGIIGSIFFYAFLFFVLNKIRLIFMRPYYINYFFIAILVASTMLISATSGCLFLNPQIWLPLVFLASINLKKSNV